ncbi:MAG: 3-dehydroquinate synthase [Candidatus Omnitrophota bacterium]
MNTIKLNLKNRSYAICIEKGLILKTGCLLKKINVGKDAIIITNKYIKKRFGTKVKNSLLKHNFSCKFLTVPDSEKAKSIKYCFDLIDKISKYDKKKQLFLIALGGGVIGDLTGFVASIYKRGVPYIQIPTTLLAQIDSSIGGKTAIDLKVAKNLVGAFYQPKLVIVDPGLLQSLPPRQLRSGLAEVIKYALIKDKSLFSFLKNNQRKILSFEKNAIELIERKCIAIKAKVVEIDEQEKKGIRTILNFGHTIGHALESAAKYTAYSHGEAISLGMVCAAEIANNLNILSKSDLNKIIGIIKLFNLPVKIRGVSLNKILDSLSRDKKFVKAKNRFVLPKTIGRVIVKKNIPETIIKKAILKYSK